MSNEKVAPLMTFTGPAGRTRWDESGVLQAADENEIREDYCPRTGRYRGLLVEQAGENRLWNSRNLQGLGWVARGAPVQADGDWFVVSLGPPDAGNVSGIVQAGRSAGAGVSWAIVAPGNVSGCLFTMGDSITVRLAFDIRTLDVSYISPHIDGYGMTPLPGGACFVWVYADGTGYPSDRSSGISISPIGNEGDTLRVFAAQHEPNVTRPSSLIITGDNGAARARDDARFTNPAIFGNFERGSFVVEWETQSLDETGFRNYILYRGGNGRILAQHGGEYGNANQKGQLYSYDGSSGLYTQPPPFKRCKAVVSFENGRRTMCVTGGEPVFGPWNGTFGNGDVVIGEQNWSGWMPRISFLPEALTPQQQKRIVAMPRRTTIASGTILGDYDPNERLSLFQDRHGIKPVERDGDPVRFMLDLGPQGNHLQAAPESTGLVYRADGEKAWIEYNGVNDYFQYRAGPILRGDISVSTHIAAWLDHTSGPSYRKIVAQGTYENSDSDFFVGWARENYFHGSVGYEQPVFKAAAPSDIQKKWFGLTFSSDQQGLALDLNGNQLSTASAFDNGGYSKGPSFFIGRDGFNGGHWRGRLGRITLTADADQADRDAIDAEIIDRYVGA